jgi:hypothetical protein
MKYLLSFIFILVASRSMAQINALTDNGREVILYDDGTWKYSNDSLTESLNKTDSIKINSTPFTRSKSSTFLVKSKTVNMGVYINPAKWSFTSPKTEKNELEYQFSLKSKDGYGMIVSEKTSIGLENMPEVALINAKKAAKDARIVKSEYRTVNNIKVLCLQMKATVSGIKFIYYCYYYSDESGTIQLMTYTSEDLFKTVLPELDGLLNGLVLLPSK